MLTRKEVESRPDLFPLDRRHQILFDLRDRVIGIWEDEQEFKMVQANYNSMPQSFSHCMDMIEKYSERARRHAYTIRKCGYGQEAFNDAEKSCIRWERMKDDAIDGKPSDIFKVMGKLFKP